MGKADQQATQSSINNEQNRQNSTQATNISDSQRRVQDTTQQAAGMKNDIWNGYSSLANNPGAGGAINQDASNRLLSGDYSSVGNNTGTPGSGGGGGTGEGGGGGATGGPSYLDTYNQLLDPKNAFDPGRLANIEGAASSLYDTRGNYGDVNDNISKLSNASGNYGATNTAVTGLNNFASTGGLNDQQKSDIQRQSLKDMESTGGYTAADIANERARGNAGVAATYANMQDQIQKQRAVQGANVGPGFSAAGFKLARQSAQDIGTNTQATEAAIHSAVNANKLAAGGKLSDAALAEAGLQSQNTLTGYTNAGNLDISKNTAIQDAQNKAGNLGLGRESQIDAAKEAAAGIDLNAQGLTNNTRLAAAGGLSQDTLGRLGIGASSSAAAAANALGYANLNSANQRFLISEQDANRNTGLGGMLNTYSAAPTDQEFQQNLLRGYNQDATNANQNLIGDRINASKIPGVGSSLSSGLGVLGSFANVGSGLFGALGGLGGGGGSEDNPYLGDYISQNASNPYAGIPGPTNPNHE